MPHDPLVRRKYPATCTIEGCERPARVKGLCKTHYGRTIRYGDALPDLPIKMVIEMLRRYRPEVLAKPFRTKASKAGSEEAPYTQKKGL